MALYRAPLLLLFSVIILTACSEDDPTTMTHYFNPVWSPDGSTFVAGYLQGPVSVLSEPVGPPGSLAVYDMATRSFRIVDLGDVSTMHAIYQFDPSGQALSFIRGGGIVFFDLSGRELLAYTPSEGGTPVQMAFSNTGNSFIWVGETAGEYTVNQTLYSAGSWAVENQMTLLMLPKTAELKALAMTSQRSAALRFADGTVKEYDFNGSELNSFSTLPFANVNPWQQRLIYYTLNGQRLLYARDGDGIHRFDLESGEARQLVSGHVVDLDVSSVRRSMVYETGTGDTWIATVDGNPLTRIAPQHLMPRISPAGNGIALVERIDDYTDSLHVLLLR